MLRPWNFEMYVNYSSDKAIYLQIADAIIADIYAGRLQAGDTLPGSRILAKMFKVNRNTVVEALEVLINEGWVVSKERKGTFIADTLPIFTSEVVRMEEKTLGQQQNELIKKYRIHLDDGYPDTKIAPVTELARAYRQIFNRHAKWQMMGYSSEFGHPDFIDAVVQMLNHQRGMQVNKDSICVTRGSQMAMYLVSHCLLKSGDIVAVEYPGYQDAWKVFENAGALLVKIPVDTEGIQVDELRLLLEKGTKVSAVYITPHHQYPTTVTLSLTKRLELIRLSNEFGFTVIEDDYDNEFHYGARPLLPVSSMHELKNFVYIGTMSKVVAPALRIGYLASNNYALVKKIGSLRKLIDVQGDGIMEQAVLQLINEGAIKRHLRKVSSHYRAKRDFVEVLLREHLMDRAKYIIPSGGLAFWIEPKRAVDWNFIAESLEKESIKFITPDHYGIVDQVGGIRIGFGALSNEELSDGIKAIAKFFPRVLS